jgi:hypothetical protein
LPHNEFVSITEGKGPLLSIWDFDHIRWQVLDIFGVGVKNDVKFYLFWLNELSGSPVKPKKVKELLSQIQARCTAEQEPMVKYDKLRPHPIALSNS